MLFERRRDGAEKVGCWRLKKGQRNAYCVLLGRAFAVNGRRGQPLPTCISYFVVRISSFSCYRLVDGAWLSMVNCGAGLGSPCLLAVSLLAPSLQTPSGAFLASSPIHIILYSVLPLAVVWICGWLLPRLTSCLPWYRHPRRALALTWLCVMPFSIYPVASMFAQVVVFILDTCYAAGSCGE